MPAYVAFLRAVNVPPRWVKIEQRTREQVNGWSAPGERALVLGQDVALWLAKGFHEARFPTAGLWRSTSSAEVSIRDIKVVRAVVDKWC